ncbi:MAG: 5'-3' exonuclease H3TH domain-containing protein [Actinomycetota bacterium]|nr:5'-3' exonuclease [Actinomycetota bacterium]
MTLLVDASSLIYRAFFSMPDTVRSPSGMPMNAAHGFIDMLTKLVADRDPSSIACATDEAWRPQWRVDLIETYKTHRLDLDPTPDLDAQIPVIFDLVERCGVSVVGLADYEAEDVIGTLAARATGRVEIVSGDRDLFQLVRDPDVCILYPKRGVSQVETITEELIAKKYGIPGRAYGDFAILRGDPSDGLPGVPGVGEKSAAFLISKYGSLEAVVEAAMTADHGVSGPLAKVKRSLDYLDRAVNVVLISSDLPIPVVDLTRSRKPTDPDVVGSARGYGLSGPVSRLLKALEG